MTNPKTASSISSGLDVLFGYDSKKDFEYSQLTHIPVDALVCGKYQPRKNISQDHITSLASSITMHGILQPIIVRKANEKFEIIAGECRYRAAKSLSLDTVPAIIMKIDDRTALAFGIVENIQRKALNPIEEAESFRRLIDEFKLTHEEVAEHVGLNRTSITNSLRLLSLPFFIQTEIADSVISTGHAKSILGLNEQGQTETVNSIKSEKLTVRQTEALVRQLKQKKKSPESSQNVPAIDELNKIKRDTLPLLPWLSDLQYCKKKFCLEIKFNNITELKKCLHKLTLEFELLSEKKEDG